MDSFHHSQCLGRDIIGFLKQQEWQENQEQWSGKNCRRCRRVGGGDGLMWSMCRLLLLERRNWFILDINDGLFEWLITISHD